MAETIKGNNLIEWGAGEAAGNYGKIQSASRKDGGEKLELKDENGETFCVIYFDEKGECEIECIVQSNVALPVRGDQLALCGVTNALCDEVELRWQNADAKRVSIRATKYGASLTLS